MAHLKSLIRTSNQTNNGNPNPITLDYKTVLTSDGVRGAGGVGCRKFPLLSEPQEKAFVILGPVVPTLKMAEQRWKNTDSLMSLLSHSQLALKSCFWTL